MPAEWTGDVVRTMHLYCISQKQLSEKLGVSLTWVNAILAGRRTAKNAETQFRTAVQELANTN